MKVSDAKVSEPGGSSGLGKAAPKAYTEPHSDRFERIRRALAGQSKYLNEEREAEKLTPITPPRSGVSNDGMPVVRNESTLGAQSAPSVSAARLNVEHLAAEIVQHIHAATTADGRRSVEIQFNSKTLDGLQVRVEDSKGSITVSFAARTENVAALLENQAPQLKRALEARGMTVANVSVTGSKARNFSGRPARGRGERNHR